VKGATTPACQPGGSAAAQVLTVPQPRRHDIPVTMAEMTGAKLLRLMSIEAGRLADIAARLPPGRAAATVVRARPPLRPLVRRQTGSVRMRNRWRVAAQAGNLNGMASLAEILRKRGDDRDAPIWASKAAERGNANGMASLAETLRKRGDDRDAEAWASKAAHAGNSPGIIRLAQILRARGDDSAADIWAARAAELDGDMTE
jgi:hypothetical protein